AGPELLQQTLADLVGALILGDLLAEQEDAVVAPHLLGDRVAQGLAHGLGDRLAGVFAGIGGGRRRRPGRRGNGAITDRRPRRGRLRLLIGRYRHFGLGCFGVGHFVLGRCRPALGLGLGLADVLAILGDDRD